MDGVLYKWTNYLSGWQPRWFLLGGGVLSYYDSREDAWKGCKGSIQMAVCEIQVHSTDNTRMDLFIPGEQYFYLKARNAAERQKWLVALGTAKACLTDIRTQKEKGKLFSEFTENTEVLKKRMAELRLYCDLLVQQVDKTKEMGLSSVAESENGIDMGALLKSTCTTFLKTLEECMQIANTAFSSELLQCTPSGSPHSAALKSNKLKPPGIPSHTVSERQMELKNCENGSIYANSNFHEQTLVDNRIPVLQKTDEMNCEVNAEENLTGDISEDGGNQLPPKEENHDGESLQPEVHSASQSTSLHLAEEDKDFPTFFSVMSNRFSDIDLLEDGGIPTEEFLQSCYAIVPVLDKLGSTVFAPVKMDFVGNIKKINQKYITNKDEFNTLQKIVLHEVNTEEAQVRNSATEALLWLKRGLKFLKEFLTELKNGEKNIQTALSPFILVDGITLPKMTLTDTEEKDITNFSSALPAHRELALRASPTYECFVAALSVGECDHQEHFYRGMQRDLNIYLPAMEKQLGILDALYEEHGLESDEVV